MGAPISSHHGVLCCPAMRLDSEDKYIVKVISIPSSQVQLDALLLTGAYKDSGDAMDYFRTLADGIAAEADLLSTVSKLEGFLPYEGWQVVPMEDNLGYQVYLLGTYKRSLEKHLRRSTMTHMEAVNLGLDLCNALSACRRAGAMYIALKPSNIFLSEDREFRIGDLGFVSLDSLAYTALPVNYRSPYSPAEAQDPLQTLNNTIDTYGVGMILYQIYNGGKLPQDPSPVSPAYAEPELAQIILKAIAPDPAERYADPVQMGQDLAQYLQTHTVRDTPITAEPEAVPAADTDTKVFHGPVTAETQVFSTVPETVPAADLSAQTQVLPDGAAVQQAAAEVHQEETKILPDAASLAAATAQGAAPAPQVHTAAAAPTALYDDDDEEWEEDEEDTAPGLPAKSAKPQKKKRSKGGLVAVLLILLLAGLSAGGIYFYQNQYLQTIHSMTVEGAHDALTVYVDTQIPNEWLTVTCTDTYGNNLSKTLYDGKAEFADLLPNTQYKISLEIEGFHRLVGKTSDVFNTDSRTEIISFGGITGSEDGSVMLNFTVDGTEPAEWVLTYSAEGVEEKTERFTGHAITVRGLELGKDYVFILTPGDDLYVTGATTFHHTASAVVLAQDLTISSFDESEMTVRWTAPPDSEVPSWTVRCTSLEGYDATLEVTETKAVFSGLDPQQAYSVEVTAQGMTQPARTSITANPITITSFKVDTSDWSKLTVSWEHQGASPEGGWILMYSLDGSNSQNVVKCEGTTVEISPSVPGASYKFVIQSASSNTIFSNSHTFQRPEAEVFFSETNKLNAEKVTALLLPTPEDPNWYADRINKDDYTDTFHVDQSVSVVLKSSVSFYIYEEDISILYVIRDSEGNVIPKLVAQDSTDWHDLWVTGSTQTCELDLPGVPTQPGDYRVDIYFNGCSFASADFSIVE